MTFPKVRVVVALLLFLSWLSFLGYLVSERNAVILSRPQFAVAQAIVVADLQEGSEAIAIQEIVWCSPNVDREAIRKGVALPELLSCGKNQGFSGKGTYVIPLVRRDNTFQIAPVQTPGFPRQPSHGELRIRDGGPKSDQVLSVLTSYAKKKPLHANDLLNPLTIPVVEWISARSFFPDADWPLVLHQIDLPTYLPIADANQLRAELGELKASIDLRKIELRIYPANSDVRQQLQEILAAKPH